MSTFDKYLIDLKIIKRIRFQKEMWPPQDNLHALENDFSENEIKRTIWDLGQDKGPGPYGFPIFFFLTSWSSIKQDLINLLEK